MKRFLFLLLVLVGIGISAKADFTYEVNGDGSATITGYSGDIPTNLVIPASIDGHSVTSIGAQAFYGCSTLTSVAFPNSISSINRWAFSGCFGLTRVDITDIAAWCGISFNDFTSNPLEFAHHLYLNGSEITKLIIPNTVTKIGNYAFDECSALTSVTIPNSVTEIGGGAFFDCTGLTSVTIPNSVTEIGEMAFEGCTGLISVTIGNSVSSIGTQAFYGCHGLTSIVIPNSVTEINTLAFAYCTNLTSVSNLATTPQQVPSNTFYGVNTSNVDLFVPLGCSDAYLAADVWKDFRSIQEFTAPIFALPSGVYESPFEVFISAESGAEIRYTTDGTDPTPESTLYTTLILSDVGTTTVKAIAVKDGHVSGIAMATYTIFPESLYILGEVNGNSWAPNVGVQMTSTHDGKFNAVVNTLGASQGYSYFSFTTKLGTNSYNWSIIADYRYGADSNDKYVTLDQSMVLQAGENAFKIGAGTFFISVDFIANTVFVSEYTQPVKPYFSPDGGTYDGPQSVYISSLTSDAVIYYTTDGTDPTIDSDLVYSGIPISISETTTLKAIAVKNGLVSETAEATYTILHYPTSLYVLGEVNGNTWMANVGVEMNWIEDGKFNATVTTDGATEGYSYFSFSTKLGSSDHDWGSIANYRLGATVDPTAVVLDQPMTLQAGENAFKIGAGTYVVNVNLATNSVIVSEYTPPVPAAPTFSPPPGKYYQCVNISITSETEDAEIHITFHGEDPDENSFLLTKELTITNSYTIKAIAIKDGMSSEIVTGEYVITDEPVVGDYMKVYNKDMPLKEGKYLILCEYLNFVEAGTDGLRDANTVPVINPAFNGNNPTQLDTTDNYVKVSRFGDTVSAGEDDNFYFTIIPSDAENNIYSIRAANGNYIGRSSNVDGLDEESTALENVITIDANGNADIVGTGGAYLRFNSSLGEDRFRYFNSITYMAKRPIQLYSQKVTSVDPVSEEGAVVETTYYNLYGVRIDKPSAGQILIKVDTLSNGKISASKVLVK